MLQYDSRKIEPGDTFICLPKGEAYIEDAKSKGASHILHLSRAKMAALANKHYKRPSSKLTVIGITGTNGKTTVSSFLGQALREMGDVPFVLGTLNSPLTTPESLDIQRLMAEHLKNGGTHFILEVSSHGIDQDRVLNIDFDVKILTNITQDHLDYHGTFQAYKETKLRFMKEYPGPSIYPADYKQIDIPYNKFLSGSFNKDNLQSAKSVLLELGYDSALIDDCLSRVIPPPGRFEFIHEGQSFLVVVDFAHTPDGLETVLVEGKKLAKRRGGNLITLFGCGGDRDKTKRPLMGKIAAKYSDKVIITQDNPRKEDEAKIVHDILAGLPVDFQNYEVVHDRLEAIQQAITQAKSRDIVIIAGKGHEKTQILNTGPVPFDDRQLATKTLHGLPQPA